MKTSIPKLRSVRFKNGGFIRLLNPQKASSRVIDLGWGSVITTYYDDVEPECMDRDTSVYMMEAAKSKLIDIGE